MIMTHPSYRRTLPPPARAAGRWIKPQLLLLLAPLLLGLAQAFTVAIAGHRLQSHPVAPAPGRRSPVGSAAAVAAADSAAHGDTSQVLSLSLAKPLGLVLEEAGPEGGVVVAAVGADGSAAGLADQLQGRRLAAIQGRDVTALPFDAVMELFAAAPDTVALQVLLEDAGGSGEGAPAAAEGAPAAEAPRSWEVGAPVTITVARPGAEDLRIEARVGDNLRRALLDGGVEVYQGLREKLGNCGGAGQCTFCAVDLLEGEGWEERSEYEEKKLAKFPSARLACLNNIQGPATVQKTQR